MTARTSSRRTKLFENNLRQVQQKGDILGTRNSGVDSTEMTVGR